jgi:hypothetical protein
VTRRSEEEEKEDDHIVHYSELCRKYRNRTGEYLKEEEDI